MANRFDPGPGAVSAAPDALVDPGHGGEVDATGPDHAQHDVDAELALVLPVHVAEIEQQRVLVENQGQGDPVADAEEFLAPDRDASDTTTLCPPTLSAATRVPGSD